MMQGQKNIKLVHMLSTARDRKARGLAHSVYNSRG